MMRPSMQEASAAVRRLAASPDWRMFCDYLEGRFGFAERTTFVSGDSHETAFNEGHRALVRHILLLETFGGEDDLQRQSQGSLT